MIMTVFSTQCPSILQVDCHICDLWETRLTEFDGFGSARSWKRINGRVCSDCRSKSYVLLTNGVQKTSRLLWNRSGTAVSVFGISRSKKAFYETEHNVTALVIYGNDIHIVRDIHLYGDVTLKTRLREYVKMHHYWKDSFYFLIDCIL